jgi:hypothetical protein
MNAEELREILQEKGMDWLIAAMVEGSIGYHSLRSARVLIESALNGETRDACERCLACYRGNLLDMIESDVSAMRFLETNIPEKADRLVKSMQQMGNLTLMQEMTASMMYPTMGI